jgi:MauM/NapG family ferredoxin protein
LTVRKIRIVSQLFFLGFFLYLFWMTSIAAERWITVDLFLRADPLLAIIAMLTGKILIPAMLIAVVIIILTLILGRVFCGWACPMGATLDIISRMGRSTNRLKMRNYHHLKYYILIGILVCSLFGFHIAYHIDPIALITRIFTAALLPVVVNAFNFIFNNLFGISWLQIPLLKLQSSLSDTLLPLEPYYFQAGFVIGLIFTVIVAFELYSRRVYCQTICPLGALLGWASKPLLLKRKVLDGCTSCGECQAVCKTNAIPDDFESTEYRECIQCFNCVDVCPENVNVIDFSGGGRRHTTDFMRRRLILSGVGGVGMASILGISFIRPGENSRLIRPPGSLPEDEFIDRCVRCYQCIRACATSGNFLQPSLLEGGWEGLLTPYGVARTGYCEYNCILCTEVCPSGAIHPLDVETKRKTAIGLAHISKDLCLPYAEGTPCIVCEEHCPTPEKAIRFTEEEYTYPDGSKKVIKFPYVVPDLCIGCGICETKCPIEGESAIYITNQNQQRYGEESYGYG